MSAAIHAVVGEFYMVPCIWIATESRLRNWPEWVPVLGPRHDDADHLNLSHEHYHVDWRFVSARHYVGSVDHRTGTPHATVITSGTERWKVDGRLVEQRLKCRRLMPDFPNLHAILPKSATLFAALEQHQADTCPRLKAGNVCPHRGIDLTPFIKPDGTAICPGHGLKWDTATGALLRHHRAEAC